MGMSAFENLGLTAGELKQFTLSDRRQVAKGMVRFTQRQQPASEIVKNTLGLKKSGTLGVAHNVYCLDRDYSTSRLGARTSWTCS